jgi:hypothetical protein
LSFGSLLRTTIVLFILILTNKEIDPETLIFLQYLLISECEKQSFQTSPELLWVERMSKLLDSKFRIPGTSIRFGLDPIFGLLPVAGDLGTMLISLSLIYTMYQNGASGKLVAKMILECAR